MPEFRWPKLLDAGFLLAPDPPEPGIYVSLLAALLALGCASSLGYYFGYARSAFAEHRYRLQVARAFVRAGAITCGVGLFLFLMRLLGVPFLSARLLLLLASLCTLGVVVYFVYFYLLEHPKRLAEYEARVSKRHYLPGHRARPMPLAPSAPRKRARRR